MDVNEYISSGILEAYALGLVSSQEKKEVECMSHIYPEIQEELNRVSQAMEDMALKQQVQAPAHLKAKIFAALPKEAPATAQKDTTAEAKIVPMAAGKPSQTFKWLAAACFIGLVGIGDLYMNERSAKTTLNNELAEVKTKMGEKEQAIDQLSKQNTYSQQELAMFRNPDFKTVFLKGTPAKPQNSLAIVCANPQTGETMMAVENLPELPTDKQYQLWAIVNGTPVDMGVLPKDSAAVRSFFKVKNVEGAQAFAITMEKDGGNPTPTLEEMYVMGTI